MISPSPVVLALPHARVYGHPRPLMRRQDRGELLLLPEALTRSWSSDAHLVAYSASKAGKPSRWRLTSEAPGEFTIVMQLAIFDCDAPGHAASDEWWTAELPKLARLPGSPFIYRTRGGYRIVWKLAEPFPIKTTAGAAEWKARYLAFCDQLLREHGIVADRSCSDWTRLFRLPHATRDPAHGPEQLETIGDPTEIGAIELPPAPEANHNTRPLCGPENHDRAHDSCSPQSGRVVVCSPDEAPTFALYKLLESRGEIVKPHPSKANCWIVLCPNRVEHSVDTDRSDSTILVAPESGGYGALICQHSHCCHLTSAQWLAILDGTQATEILSATISAVYVEHGRGGAYLKIHFGGAVRPLRVYANNPTRWDALFEAADLDPPDPDDERDVERQARGLVGERIALEHDGTRIRRILAATDEKSAAPFEPQSRFEHAHDVQAVRDDRHLTEEI